MLIGAAITVVTAAGYFIPVIRNAEDLLPDHDQTSPQPASAEEDLDADE
jgi:hypothetical protein